MNPSLYYNLWKFHPGKRVFPCNVSVHKNQCAIRMGIALHESKVDLKTFHGAVCWENHSDDFKHILRAQELAYWIDKHPSIFGNKKVFTRKKFPKLHHSDFWKMKGIIFIQNGWGPTDHIDIWNGSEMKGGETNYIDRNFDAIWFWELI